MAQGAAIALMVAGTALNVVGNMNDAEASARASEYNARQADIEAYQADENARLVQFQSREEASREAWRGKKLMGSIRAAYGASGVTLEGSPQEYIDESTAILKANELAIRHKGYLQSAAYKDQARKYRDQAEFLRGSASSARSSGLLKGVASTVGGAGAILKRVG